MLVPSADHPNSRRSITVENATFKDCEFLRVQMQDFVFRDTVFKQCNFSGMQTWRVDFSNVIFEDCIMKCAQIRLFTNESDKIRFIRCNLTCSAISSDVDEEDIANQVKDDFGDDELNTVNRPICLFQECALYGSSFTHVTVIFKNSVCI